jgi:hypothetical protein
MGKRCAAMPATPGKHCVAVPRFGLVLLRVAVAAVVVQAARLRTRIPHPYRAAPQLGTALASSAVIAILAVRTVWT